MTEPRKDLALNPRGGLAFKSLDEAFRFAEFVSKSALCPQALRNKPGDALLAMQFGIELGLPPMRAIQSVNVINGTPSLKVDAQLALVQASGLLVSYAYGYEGDPKSDEFLAFVVTRRKGREEDVRSEFSVASAKRAGLWGKATWKSYPRDMLLARAKGRNLGENFPDVIGGYSTEEVQDIPANVPASAVNDEGATVVVLNNPDPILEALEGSGYGETEEETNG